MPIHIKSMISAAALIAAGALHYFQAQAGQTVTPWVALALGVFMVVAMWIFPEKQGKGGKKPWHHRKGKLR